MYTQDKENKTHTHTHYYTEQFLLNIMISM